MKIEYGQKKQLYDNNFRTEVGQHGRSRRVRYGVVQMREEIVNDSKLLAKQILVSIADGSANPRPTVDTPVVIKESRKVSHRVAPELGEHAEQVLEELGFDAAQIDDLRANGAVPPTGANGAIPSGTWKRQPREADGERSYEKRAPAVASWEIPLLNEWGGCYRRILPHPISAPEKAAFARFSPPEPAFLTNPGRNAVPPLKICEKCRLAQGCSPVRIFSSNHIEKGPYG